MFIGYPQFPFGCFETGAGKPDDLLPVVAFADAFGVASAILLVVAGDRLVVGGHATEILVVAVHAD